VTVGRPLHEDRRERQVHAAETRLLYDNACTGILSTLVIAALLAFAQRHVTSRFALWAWLLYLLLISAARYILVRRYRRAAPTEVDSRGWSVAFAVGVALAAAGWSAAALVFYTPDRPINQAFLLFVIGGVMLGRRRRFMSMAMARGSSRSLRMSPTPHGERPGDEQSIPRTDNRAGWTFSK
jgi:hypothetical protein